MGRALVAVRVSVLCAAAFASACTDRGGASASASTARAKALPTPAHHEADVGSADAATAPVTEYRASANGETGLDGAERVPSTAKAEGSHPLDGHDQAELEQWLLEDMSKLGSISLGPPDAGALINGVRMPEGEHWTLVKANQSWGTQETIDFITAAVEKVNEQFDDAPPLYIGDISRARGGFFYPHKYHQNGRDVDLGFYYSEPRRWYTKVWRGNLDVEKTWALVKALVTETDVELIYCDRYVIALLKEHAQAIGEDREWLDQIFRQSSAAHQRPLIRHEDGHRTHIHVRFYNPIAQESGRRLFSLLEKHEMFRQPIVFADHVVKRGETLRSIAKLYKTGRAAIRQFNKMSSDDVVVGKSYRVPYQGELEPLEGPFVAPPRKLPPEQ